MTSTSKRSRSEFSPRALQQDLQQAMQHCRQITLAQFDRVDDVQLRQQVHPDFSPIGWHLGHIAYTEALWLLEQAAQQPCLFPQYRRLFAADGLPKSDRSALPELDEIKAYLAAVRSQVLDALTIAPLPAPERLWHWLLQHESQHSETIAIVLALQTRVAPPHATSAVTSAAIFPESSAMVAITAEMVLIPAGQYACGNETIAALDNERPAHAVPVDRFWIDRFPVTCADYARFLTAGGYSDARWWSVEGWNWLRSVQVTQPLYWTSDPSMANHPVCGISWYEADAYARFVGKRLPTESEWEAAATWHPEHPDGQSVRFPWGDADPSPEFCNCGQRMGGTTAVDCTPIGSSPSGCCDLIGNVWEWTATWFDGYPGFAAYPYRGYSQAYFDRQHRVLKGGSWATLPWALRSTFRNWYHPHVREIFAGFRCAADAHSPL